MSRTVKYVLIALTITQLAFPAGSDIFKSLILPGWGESSMGHSSRAKFFFASEILVISSHLLGKRFYNSYVDQYTGMAELYAGVDMDGRDYDFIIDMPNHDSMTDYNNYTSLHHYKDVEKYLYDSDTEDWNWESTSKRQEFDELRRNSVIAEMVADFALAGLLLNRVISLIDVVYLSKRESRVNLGSHLSPDVHDGVSLNISLSFK